MAMLKYWDPEAGVWRNIAFPAQGEPGKDGLDGEKGDKGDKGDPGNVGPLDSLTNVTAPNTPVGKILGTTGPDAWEPIDPPVGDVTEAPVDGSTYGRKDAGWTEIVVTGFLPLAGGVLTGPLTLDGSVPASDATAADKAYVDSRIWTGTQAQYDAIPTKDPEVLYVVTG